jgi:hypothetical protein
MRRLWISAAGLFFCIFAGGANAWFFVFLPGKVIESVGDAITGSEGANCVSAGAKVGDSITVPGGSAATVKSLSGTSVRCTNPELPVRALLVASAPSAATATPTAMLESKARIDLANGWESKTLSDQQRANGIILYAVNRTIDSGMFLGAAKREGITDMATYAITRRAAQVNRLTGTSQSEVLQTSIDGRPAWRFEVTGATKSGARFTFYETIIDAGTEVIALSAWTTAAAFETHKPTLKTLAESISGLTPNTSPAVAAAPPPAQDHPPVTSASGQPGIATTKAPADAPDAVPSSASMSTPTQRLRELTAARKENLIDQEEFDERRRKIIDAM